MKVVLFDVDGTLIDAHREGRRALVSAFSEVYGLEADAVDGGMDRVTFAGHTDHWILEEAAAVLGLRLDGRRDALTGSYLSFLRGGMERNPSRPLPGVGPLLAELSDRSDRAVGLMTGNLREGARIKLAACGLDGYFQDGGFGEDGVERSALGIAAHRRIQARLGRTVEPRDVAVVGDTHHDILAARACGFRAVAVETGWGDPRKMRDAGPDVLLPDLTDPGWLLGVWDTVVRDAGACQPGSGARSRGGSG